MERKKERTWTWHHITVFVLTFVAYALYHGCRKSWSNVKDTLEKELTAENRTRPVQPYMVWQSRHLFGDIKDADVFSGILDSLFLFAYAIGLYISGIIGDRLNLKYFLSCGMILSAVSTFVFGYVSEVTGTRNRYFYGITYFLCGLFQSTGWPATVAIMGNWFPKAGRGLIFGIWAANTAVGNILGSLVVSSVLDYGYEYGMLLTSYFLFCGGVAVLVCLYSSPTEIDLPPPELDDNEGNFDAIDNCLEEIELESLIPEKEDDRFSVAVQNKEAISLFRAVMLPGVIPYSLSYAFLKLVNYSFFFWLPVYLSQGLKWSDKSSNKLANFYDIGSVFGGILAGLASDLLGKRSPVIFIFLLLSVGCLYLYNNIGDNYQMNVAVMALTGFAIGGPGSIISTAITADLGKQQGVGGNRQALATVTGIVDGTGSIGAAIGQYLVPVINRRASWHRVFDFLILMVILTVLCILPMLYKDLKCSRCKDNRKIR